MSKNKSAIWSVLIFYTVTYFLQSLLYVISFANAEQIAQSTQIVSIFVDNELYKRSDVRSDIIWYSKDYLQQRINSSKAIVIPVDINTISANDIVRMLENVYFDGEKNGSSKLIGTILVGNIPLPVVKKNNTTFPSVMPYVDFEDQAYLYNDSSKFFEFQQGVTVKPELRHGVINLGSGSAEYVNYFSKLKKYSDDPTSYVAKKIRYDDFIDLKKHFLPENLSFYVNKIIFSEDLAYHRYTNVLLNLFQGSYNSGLSYLGDMLNPESGDSAEIAGYKANMQDLLGQSLGSVDGTQATPTLLLEKSLAGYQKNYSDLYGTLALNRMKERVNSLSRYSKIDSHLQKINLTDDLVLGSDGVNPLVVDANKMLEDAFNKIVDEQKYSLRIPISTEFRHRTSYIESDNGFSNLLKCSLPLDQLYLKGRYENFYFGKSAWEVNSLSDLTIYRGTYKNYTELSQLQGVQYSGSELEDINRDVSKKSIGSTSALFSRQIEAQRGYNYDLVQKDLDEYDARKEECYQACEDRKGLSSFGKPLPNECKYYNKKDKAIGFDEFVYNYFAGVTPANLTTENNTPVLNYQRYEMSWNPAYDRTIGGSIFDIAGSKLLQPAKIVKYPIFGGDKNKREKVGEQSISVGGTGQQSAYKLEALSIYSQFLRTEIEYKKTVRFDGGVFDFIKNLISFYGKILASPFSADAVEKSSRCFASDRLDSSSKIDYAASDFFNVYANKKPGFQAGEYYRIVGSGPKGTKQDVRDQRCASADIGVTILDEFVGAKIGGNYKDKWEYLYKTIDSIVIKNSPNPAQISGMNLTTPDRPIDSVRSISFVGIGGDNLDLKYPNLYFSEVFDNSQNRLNLKSKDSIKVAIKDYLRKKIEYYNQRLQEQLNKKDLLYMSRKDGYDFLKTIDDFATPNRTYSLIPLDYFEKVLGDELINSIANQLYYQNIGFQQRLYNSGILLDIDSQKDFFDINQKISYSMNNLKSDYDSGYSIVEQNLITPDYEKNGYEVAYINSDGFDIIGSVKTPSFVEAIISRQAQYDQTQQQDLNSINSDITLAELDRSCDVDTDGRVEITKRPKAISCRIKETVKNIKDGKTIEINFNNAQGPVYIADSLKKLLPKNVFQNQSNNVTDFSDNINKFANQWDNIANQKQHNEQLLLSLPQEKADILKNVIDSVEVKFFKTQNGSLVSTEQVDQIQIGDVSGVKNYVALSRLPSEYNFPNMDLYYSSTGDNCIIIKNQNSCAQKINLINSNLSSDINYEIKLLNQKIGLINGNFEVCLSKDECIFLENNITATPGVISKLSIKTPSDKLLSDSNIPLIFEGFDDFGNSIGLTPYQFDISGKGLFEIGGDKLTGVYVNDFSSAIVSYHLPRGNNIDDKITIGASELFNGLGLPSFSKTIKVVEGKYDVYSGNNIINELLITLPEQSDFYVNVDSNGLRQVNKSKLPKIKIKLTDLQGGNVYGVANVISKNGLFAPGIVFNENVEIDNNGEIKTFNVSKFQQKNSFVISSGEVEILLYPTFVAGEDILQVEIPGVGIKEIKIKINPSSPQVVNMDTKSKQLVQGGEALVNVSISDRRGNIINKPVNLLLTNYGGVDLLNSGLNIVGGSGNFVIRGSLKGGNGHVVGIIQGLSLNSQKPGIISLNTLNSVIPTEGINSMYLSLFGNDRGNYFEREKSASYMINNSKKLLSVTTLLQNPTNLSPIIATIRDGGLDSNLEKTLKLIDSKIVLNLGDIASYDLGSSSGYSLVLNPTSLDYGVIGVYTNNSSGLSVENDKIIFQDNIVFNLVNGYVDQDLNFVVVSTSSGVDLSISYQNQQIGTAKINMQPRSNQDILDALKIKNQSATKSFGYGEGSSNRLNGVVLRYGELVDGLANNFQSIENSDSLDSSIGFEAGMQNISQFAGGKNVGEATLGNSSEFLINLGDPLVSRIDDNDNLENSDYDSNVGDVVYTDPVNSISQARDFDFNSDGQKDLVVLHDNGSVKILKNYGGKNPYRDIGSLLFIPSGVKKFWAGDTDGNKYDDLFVQLEDSSLRVYRNNNGIFDVDGYPVCLDVPGGPKVSDSVSQIFIEDMDNDSNLDIVTNDIDGVIKIFYGGNTNGGPNYISKIKGDCDSEWKNRQQTNLKVVKQFGLKLFEGDKIYDQSLIRWKGVYEQEFNEEAVAPMFSDLTDNEAYGAYGDSPAVEDGGSSKGIKKFLKMFKDGGFLKSMKDFLGNMGNSENGIPNNITPSLTDVINRGLDLKLQTVVGPIEYKPLYDSGVAESLIHYYPISRIPNDGPVSVYKTYKNLSGGILTNGSQVEVTIHFVSKQNITVTYADYINGPWQIIKDENGLISKFDRGNVDQQSTMVLTPGTEYDYIIDNLPLKAGVETKYSYVLDYLPDSLARIEISKINSDGYKDIKAYLGDSCLKTYFQFIGNYFSNARNYEEKLIDLGAKLKDENSGQIKSFNDTLSGFTNQIQDGISNGSLGDLGKQYGIQENFSFKGFLNDLVQNKGSYSTNLNIDLFKKQADQIQKKIDGALQGMCNGFSLSKKNSCPGLPIPFNMAFLSPGDYNVFGCKVATDKGLPAFFFPGTVTTPAGPIPFPYGLKSPTDSFYRADGGIYPSMVRVYLSPTLTMQLGVAVCLGPMKAGTSIPNPFRNVAGNCIVFAVPLLPGCDKKTDNTVGDEYDDRQNDLSKMGTCENPDYFDGFDSNPDLTLGSNTQTDTLLKTPFGLVTPAPDNFGYRNALPANVYGGGIFEVKKTPISRSSIGTDNNTVQLKGGKAVKLKLEGGDTKGVPKCIIQKRVDNQIKYLFNNLSDLSIKVYLPDISQIAEGFDKLNIENLRGVQKQTINENTPSKPDPNLTNATNFQKKTAGLKNTFSQRSLSVGGAYINNPFESLAKIFEEVPLIDLNTRDVNVQIPFIYTEDVLRYEQYLKSQIEINEKIIDQWSDLGADILGMFGYDFKNKEDYDNIKLCRQKKNKDERKKCINDYMMSKIPPSYDGLITYKQCIADAKGDEKRILKCQKKLVSKYLATQVDIPKLCANEKNTFSKEACANSLSKYVNFFGKTVTDFEQIQRVIRQNIKVLEEYKRFPLKLYDRMHIYDRYLTEISDSVGSITNSLATRLTTNSRRFEQYVDSIILVVGAIKTRQVILDFSVNRQAKCSKCKVDNYDQYSCGLSMLCFDIPVLPIPPFKIPNITVDLSNLDLGMSVLLPKFNFVPTAITLPRLPTLPQPPQLQIDPLGAIEKILSQIKIDVPDIDIQKTLINMPFRLSMPDISIPQISIPSIPVLPRPPQLPQLPSFIPSVKLNLPVLPPPPKIPKINPNITAALKMADYVGQLYCIMKGGIGLVGEKGVKAKIEQLTQRTREVFPFDNFNLTRNPRPLQGMDLRIDSYVNLKFKFDQVYDLVDGIIQNVNKESSKLMSLSEGFISSGSKAVNNFFDDNIRDYIPNNIKIGADSFSGIINNQKESTGVSENNQNVDIPVINDQNIDPFQGDDENNADLNIQGYKQSDIKNEIASLVSQLKNLLLRDHTVSESQRLNELINLLATNRGIEINNKGINQIVNYTKSEILKKKKEINLTKDKVKNYDQFIKGLPRNSLVYAENASDKKLSTSLLKADESIINVLKTQEGPMKSYFDLNQKLIKGYKNALANRPANELNMTESNHQKISNYLTKLDNDIDYVKSNMGLNGKDSPKIMLAQMTIQSTSSSSSNSSTKGLSVDYSQFVEGVLVKSNSGDSYINVVNSKKLYNQIDENFYQTDLNRDQKDDIVSWTKNFVSVKYAGQKSDYLFGKNYNSFYSIRSIQRYEDLVDITDSEGYANFNGFLVKVYDKIPEVKKFITKGQDADSLSLSWKNDQKSSAYLLRFTPRIDSFLDKERIYSEISDLQSQKKYVLVLPQGVSGLDLRVYVPREINDTVSNLLANGTLLSVKNYNTANDLVSLGLTDVERKRYYIQVGSLLADGEIYKKASPWSNQTLAGRQIIEDDQQPSVEISLIRNINQKVVSDGITPKGFVQTSYSLVGDWTDNVGIKKIRIESGDKVIADGTGLQIMLTGLFYKNVGKYDFVYAGEDLQGNILRQNVVLSIDVPTIGLEKIDINNGEGDLVANLSQDVDSGSVKFEKNRNGNWVPLQGISNQISLDKFNVSVDDVYVTGGKFDLTEKLGIYSQVGELLATVNPVNSDIKVIPSYQNRIDINVNLANHSPIIDFFDKFVGKNIVSMSIIPQSLSGAKVSTFNPDIEIVPLSNKIPGLFANGSCVKKKDSECLVFVSKNGQIYIPSPYNTEFNAKYLFVDGTVIYSIYDEYNKAIARIQFIPKSLIK